MSLRALFGDALKLLSAKHGIQFRDPDSGDLLDSGVEKFAEELVTYLMSRKPIKLNEPLVFEYDGDDSPLQFRLGGDSGAAIHISNELNQVTKLGIGGASYNIVANELVSLFNSFLDQTTVNNIYGNIDVDPPGPGEVPDTEIGPGGTGITPPFGVPGGGPGISPISIGLTLVQQLIQGSGLTAFSLNADLTPSGSASADRLEWNGSNFIDTGEDYVVQGSFTNGAYFSGDSLLARKFGDTYFGIGTGHMNVRGELDGALSDGGSATLSVFTWNGSAWADSGVNVTVQEAIGLDADLASGSVVKASWHSQGEIWIADGAPD